MKQPGPTLQTVSLRSESSGLLLARDLLMLAKQYDAGQTWDKAFDDAIEHILLVVSNNPWKSMQEIRSRPDVQEAMTEPFIEAALDTIENIRKTWAATAGNDISPTDMNLAIKTVRNNVKAVPKAIHGMMANDIRHDLPENLAKLKSKYSLRAQYAVEHVNKKGQQLKKIKDAKPGKKKMWWGPNAQCAACKALHGTVLELNETFDLSAGGLKLGSFGKLLSPPRHPNCACEIKIV